jgi:hypothetical protein
MLDAGCWMLDAGCWMLVAGYWILKCLMLDAGPVKSTALLFFEKFNGLKMLDVADVRSQICQ